MGVSPKAIWMDRKAGHGIGHFAAKPETEQIERQCKPEGSLCSGFTHFGPLHSRQGARRHLRHPSTEPNGLDLFYPPPGQHGRLGFIYRSLLAASPFQSENLCTLTTTTFLSSRFLFSLIKEMCSLCLCDLVFSLFSAPISSCAASPHSRSMRFELRRPNPEKRPRRP